MTNTSLHSVKTQTWTNGRHNVQCDKVIDETLDARTYCFASTEPVMHFFKPGQFVTLELEIDGMQVLRSYTISSSPSVPYSFSITVKRMPGGKVSNWLHDNLKQGDQIAVHGPVGIFNCIDITADKVLLLSGGVGITPVMSMARWWFDTNAEVDMIFAHSARTPRDIIYRRELEYMDSRITNFNLNFICERYDHGDSWSGYRGFFDEQKLRMIAPDFLERTVYCCGPTPYMAAVKSMLEKIGFDMANYHEENFGAPPEEAQLDAEQQAEDAASESVDDDTVIEVAFSKTGKSVKIQPGSTVHLAASQVGLHIPKACGMGICGTCKVKKIYGEVVMSHNGGITDEDVADGYILSCCSVPQGDISIEY
ncbi:hybrid-cluster NAD(P)-dependent oxidoreductase [Colwellia sp. MB3u-70]|uniref:hybrid-cluster NAD(P)-dependent oxidoreductase n=1 Tax=unclassified Colwellia TaxID=196834 RepID=UPI0015F41C16|nr:MULTISPECIES: hybrid-cluster NAD(P)-dependent oxidoreductase [unclassified Colwellia]MBA6292944.1 hybrid-cluster NAD(P)-dependent oxidoreductase [Colwellia sp. MB3u-8]MBA6306525.1 hybrid-cluster NAD(P)-dependent oxidoreductase [Colwellia sp. MB3u-70]